jgi:S1-C subfamily serine protease
MRSPFLTPGRAQWSRIAAALACALVAGISNRVLVAAQKAVSSRWPEPLAAVVQLVAVGPAGHGNEQECSATGFFVNAEGALLTNAHVVEEARRCLAGAPDAKILAKFVGPDPGLAEGASCDVVGIDESHDLAVLRTERPPGVAEPPDLVRETPRALGVYYLLLDQGEVLVGTRVNVTGHTGRTWQAVTVSGRVAARKPMILLGSNAESTEVLVLDIPLKRGASGSPVYLEGNRVVGVVTETDPQNPGRTVAVSSRYAVRLLDRLHVSHSISAAPR